MSAVAVNYGVKFTGPFGGKYLEIGSVVGATLERAFNADDSTPTIPEVERAIVAALRVRGFQARATVAFLPTFGFSVLLTDAAVLS